MADSPMGSSIDKIKSLMYARQENTETGLPSSCKNTLQRSRHQHPVSLKDDAFVCVIMSVQIMQTTTPEQCLQQLADLPRTGAALRSLTSHLATHHRQRPQDMQSRALRSITVCFRYTLLKEIKSTQTTQYKHHQSKHTNYYFNY